MKQLVVILLASVFLLQSASKLLIMANYQLNRDTITKLFCENKAKPQLKCNGKCHLKKQLEKEDKKENAPANNFKTKLEIQLFSEDKSSIFLTNTSQKVNHHSLYLFPDSDSHLTSVFHPPAI